MILSRNHGINCEKELERKRAELARLLKKGYTVSQAVAIMGYKGKSKGGHEMDHTFTEMVRRLRKATGKEHRIVIYGDEIIVEVEKREGFWDQVLINLSEVDAKPCIAGYIIAKGERDEEKARTDR